MSKHVNPGDLGAAIHRELTVYSKELNDALNEAGDKAVKKLVKLTKATAPTGARGRFKRNIASKDLPSFTGTNEYVWYVKGKEYRLTHLLVHGHATAKGGRTRANPFLHNALETVLPEYEKDVEEAAKRGK